MSRQERRAKQREVDNLMDYVAWIEDQFVAALFEDDGMTYKELYDAYLGYWVQVCTWFNKHVARHVHADIYYFNEVYKPVEAL
jgi:hypothetical protein